MGGRRALVAAVGVVLLVAGCSSGAQGASGPDVATSASSISSGPSASPSATTAAILDDAARARIPKAARAHTPQGAEAFARFYLEQVNQAWMVPDPELIRPYALESCKTCANIVKTAEWLRQQHYRYNGAPSDIGPSIALPKSSTDRVFIDVSTNQLSRKIIDENGNTAEKVSFAHSASEIELRWSTDCWQVREIKESL
jgi:hypothetical protein